MKFLLTVFVIALFSIAETQSEDGLEKNWTLPADFDCSNLEDGQYQDPNRCSSYIECKNKEAIEHDCGECSNPNECPEGRLHYNRKLGICQSPERANCKPPPSLPPTQSTTTGTTTPRTRPTTTTTPTSPRPPTTPRPEGECPRNCSQKGYCNAFQDCQPDGEWVWDDDSQMYWGKWQNRKCGGNLLWNPTPGVPPGGHCDFFVNLPIHIQIMYKKDQDCFCPCYWDTANTTNDICAGKYLYWNRDNENDHDLVGTEMQCPNHNDTQLLFNPIIKTCDHCSNLDGKTQDDCKC